jgi:hypothetical protein
MEESSINKMNELKEENEHLTNALKGSIQHSIFILLSQKEERLKERLIYGAVTVFLLGIITCLVLRG